MGYRLMRKTKQDSDYKEMEYCPTIEYAKKIIQLYKRRKLIRVGEKKSLMKSALWKIVPIPNYEAMMAEKDVPFWPAWLVRIFYFTKLLKIKGDY